MTLPRPTTRRLLYLTAAIALALGILGRPHVSHFALPGGHHAMATGGGLVPWRVYAMYQDVPWGRTWSVSVQFGSGFGADAVGAVPM